MELVAWLRANPAALTALGVASLVMLIASALLLPPLVARMPADYFTRQGAPGPAQRHRPVWLLLVMVIKNATGGVLLLAGIAMLFLPGQGILTILMALGLLNFPGKRTLELRIVREPHVRRAIRWLRMRAGRPPLHLPGEDDRSALLEEHAPPDEATDPHDSSKSSTVTSAYADEIDRTGAPMVHMQNVYKSFGSSHILRGIELAVYPGETVCIIGGSGSGKSVSMKLIMRLFEPDSGRIWLDGEDITTAHGDRLQQARSKLGVNFQFGALLKWLTVFDNVALPLRETTDMQEEEISRRVMAKLELLKIPQAAHMFPTEISGGMAKRAGLARAVVMEESLKVILYDEPTSGLDPISTALVDEMINGMKQRLGLTQIVVTHNMTSAFRIADRIGVLFEGKLVQFGTPEEIQASTVPYVQQFVRGLSTTEALKQRESSEAHQNATANGARK